MSRVKYALLHVPTGTIIGDFIFNKKSQAIAFLKAFPVDENGYFKRLHVDWDRKTTQQGKRELTHICNLTLLLNGIVPDNPRAHYSLTSRAPYKTEEFSPVEFVPVPITATQAVALKEDLIKERAF
jgi:hypothetical protein